MKTETREGEASPSMTVLMLVDSLQIGGTETHVLAVTKQLMAAGHRVIVGTSGGPYLGAFEDAGVEIVTMPFRSDDPLREELTHLLQHVREIVANEDIDVLHAHHVGGMKIAAHVAEETGIPLVMTIHGLYYPMLQLQRYIHSCDHIIAVSHPVARWLHEKFPQTRRRVVLIQNGIDTSEFSPGPRDNGFRRDLDVPLEETLILSCGRIAWGKTRVLAVAIESLLHLSNNDKVHLAVVGSGPDKPLIRAIATMVNRQLDREAVRFLGEQKSGLPDMYRAADIVIGSARVALEAMGCGRPVLAAGNAGYVGPIVGSNVREGWEVYFGDHSGFGPANVSRMTEDLDTLLRTRDTQSNEWERCRAWVGENFNIETVTAQIEGVYRTALKHDGAAATDRSSHPTGTLSDRIDTPSNRVHAPSDLALPAEASPVDGKFAAPPDDSAPPRPSSTSVATADGGRPLISVAIPAYNPGGFLDACLQGLFEQTYTPLEIIVVDDASTDDTPDIVAKWIDKAKQTEDRTVIYHRLPKNVGFAHALSVGYFLSTGQFIANHDADDISHPERIERQYNFLLENVECDLIGTNFESFSHSLQQRQPSRLLKYGSDIDASYRQGNHCVCFGSMLFRRRVRDRLGGLTSFADGAEDFEFVARAITQGFKVDNMRDVLYYYRTHAGQRSRTFYGKRNRIQDTVSPV